MKHTPAPWTLSEACAIDGEEDILIEHQGFPICTVRGTNDMSCIDEEDISKINQEVIATANLIAAAPDLLKSLQDIVAAGQLAMHSSDNAMVSFTELAIANALEAIKKATL
jgi:hypothetical protein